MADDRWESLREGVAKWERTPFVVGSTDAWIGVASPDTVKGLLAERDALAAALSETVDDLAGIHQANSYGTCCDNETGACETSVTIRKARAVLRGEVWVKPRTRHECPTCGRTVSATGGPFESLGGTMRVRLANHLAPGSDLYCVHSGLIVPMEATDA